MRARLVPPSLPVPTPDLVPLPEHFVHRSELHGQPHVSRVMVHAFRLLRATGHHEETTRLWASVFLHDVARTHDGRCHVRGANAWTRFEHEAWLRQRIAGSGVVEADHPIIATAVTMHSRPDELDRSHAHWRLTALLKDADGLDRVRLGDLDPRFLRFAVSGGMIAFAEELFERTDGVIPTGPLHFDQVLAIASEIDESTS